MQDVLDAIDAAFPTDLPWGGMGLHEAEAIDDGAGPEARRRAGEADRRHPPASWREVETDDLARFPHAIFHLSDDAFRFFAPAFMRCSLMAIDDPRFDEVRARTIHRFIGYGKGRGGRVSSATPACDPRCFTSAQQAAITRFLEYWLVPLGDAPSGDPLQRRDLEGLEAWRRACEDRRGGLPGW